MTNELVLFPGRYISDPEATPMSEEASVLYRKVANHCIECGRFCRISEEHGYDGSWNQIWVTYHCSSCGEITESVV